MNKSSEFYNRSVKPFLHNDIEIYSTHNEGKSVIAAKIIRTLKSKIYKYMTSVSKTVHIDKLDAIVNKYNSTYYSTIKMKPVYVKSSTYIDSSKEINDKDPKFKIGDIVRISKYKNIFAKGYTPNWSEEVFVIKKVKNTVLWTYIVNGLNGEEIVRKFLYKRIAKNKSKRIKNWRSNKERRW